MLISNETILLHVQETILIIFFETLTKNTYAISNLREKWNSSGLEFWEKNLKSEVTNTFTYTFEKFV